VLLPVVVPSKYWMQIPAFLLLGFVIWLQRRRMPRETGEAQAAHA
jgi:hypothetical protein